MTRYQVVLRIRPLPWPIRLLRHLNGCPPGSGATSARRADIWFAFLVPYRWRPAHHWWARRSRYYWLPCHACGREYGGHERDYRTNKPASIPHPTDPSLYVGICPPCTRAGRGTE